MINELFTFPIILIDGDNEERKIKSKEKFGDLPNEEEVEEYDIVQGEAEYPYWDFIGVEDRWIPSTESLNKAMKGKFEACMVRFLHAGQLLVPWNKSKFKDEMKKFIDQYEINNSTQPEKKAQELRIINLTPDQLKKVMGDEQ